MKYIVSMVGHYRSDVEVEAKNESHARFLAPMKSGYRRMGAIERVTIDDMTVQPLPPSGSGQ